MIASLICFLLPLLAVLIPALFLLPAEEVGKVLSRAVIESALIAISLTFSAVVIIALCLGIQPVLDVQRQEPGMLWQLPAVMISADFYFWGTYKILKHTDQFNRQKREFDAETEFSATDKPRPQDLERSHP